MPIRIGYSTIGWENPLKILIMVDPGSTEYEKAKPIIDRRYNVLNRYATWSKLKIMIC